MVLGRGKHKNDREMDDTPDVFCLSWNSFKIFQVLFFDTILS